jgi:signal peptidase I
MSRTGGRRGAEAVEFGASAALLLVLAGMAAALVAGWQPQIVATASMAPSVPQGALVFVAPPPAGGVVPGDVVAFRPAFDREVLVLHRVVGIGVRGGERVYTVQGDANPTPDAMLVTDGDIVGVLRWHIPVLGVAAEALRSLLGRLLLIGVPAGLVLVSFRRPRRRLGTEQTGVDAAHGTSIVGRDR